jgi:PAS domain-containing protein
MFQEKQSLPTDTLEITSDNERRKIFLRYINRAWLILGIVTLASLPIFPEQRSVFIFLAVITFPTYLIIRFINLSGKTLFAGLVFTLSVNFGFYGLFMFYVGQIGAYGAFETQSTVWMLMGLAVLFAGILVDKRAAPILAAVNTVLLIVTRLITAPNSDPRPGAVVFWWMMALTVWLYESTLFETLKRSWAEVAERKQAEVSLRESEEKYRRLLENARLGIFQSSPEGKSISVSNAFAHMFGYDSPDDAMQSIKNVGTDVFADPNRRSEIIRLMAENPDLKDRKSVV